VEYYYSEECYSGKCYHKDTSCLTARVRLELSIFSATSYLLIDSDGALTNWVTGNGPDLVFEV
jgi:hypothetical protein